MCNGKISVYFRLLLEELWYHWLWLRTGSWMSFYWNVDLSTTEEYKMNAMRPVGETQSVFYLWSVHDQARLPLFSTKVVQAKTAENLFSDVCAHRSYRLRNLAVLYDSFHGLGQSITKTYLYNFDPLKPHFYIIKLGFTGVYIIFLISAQKHSLWVLVRTASVCGYSLERSNEYPQSMFWAEAWKISEFLSENFTFFGGEIFYIFE